MDSSPSHARREAKRCGPKHIGDEAPEIDPPVPRQDGCCGWLVMVEFLEWWIIVVNDGYSGEL